jgi:ABC-type antimicrobial peptide transport system permease subunit
VTLLLWAYAAAALSLVSVGLYAMVAFGVSRRRKEIAVRIAVGATPGQIVALVGRAAIEVVGAGLVVGAAVAALVARLVAHDMYGVDPLSPASYAVATATLLAVAAIATLLPARRAARIDPRSILASET